MRIALCSHEYPPETGFGGIGTYTFYQARALARLGHEVFVLAGSTGGSRTEEHDGVQVRRHDGVATRWAFEQLGHLKWWWTRERVRNAVSVLISLRNLERSGPLDLIESPESGAEGALTNLVTRIPSVTRFHSPASLIMPFYETNRGDRRACAAIEALGIRGATALTSTSHHLASEVRRRLHVNRENPVIHNGIDIELFDRSEQVDFRALHGLPPGRPVVLFIGRLEQRKGIHLCPDVVRAVLRRYDVAFVFAGADLFEYGTRVLLPALASTTLRGSVHLLGRLTNTEVRSCLRQADIVFLPSLWESCPYSCLEAMAASRAIVCSDAGGLTELVTDRVDARVVPSGDIEGFSVAIAELLEDPGLRHRLGAQARRTVEVRFTDIETATRSLAVYERIR